MLRCPIRRLAKEGKSTPQMVEVSVCLCLYDSETGLLLGFIDPGSVETLSSYRLLNNVSETVIR